MQDVIWILLLIPLAMWILASVLRGGEEARLEQMRREQRRRPEARRAKAPLDEFMEEVQRRRSSEKRPINTKVKPVVTEETAPVRPKPAPRRPQRLSTSEPPSRLPEQVIPAAVPAAPDTEIAEVPDVSRVAVPPEPERQLPAPAVSRVHELLGSTENLQTAFLLHEILGPPKCKRLFRN
ncbi:MAG: hypothetical protein KatS3mg105_0054 [Gemmatales bacterium]|nr:MAG: hypothetical protein KatS3mg105_0054 [Gemmatales bacterium]